MKKKSIVIPNSILVNMINKNNDNTDGSKC